jgi:phage I-like protein
MPSCLVIADLPDVALEADQDTATSRIQIAKTGQFQDPRYGKFAITRKDLSTWIANFEALHLSDGREGLPIDVDHAPEKFGKTEAAGWAKKLDTLGLDGKTETPDQLWATVEWNTLGVSLVGEKRYRYISPSYQHNYADETGRRHGTALVGAALTNRPFLSMASVSLSAEPIVDAIVPADATLLAQEVTDPAEPEREGASDSPGQMALLDDLRTSLGLAADADEATVLAAVEAAKAATPAADKGDKTDKTLAEQATEQGMVLLGADAVAELTENARQGAAIAEERRVEKFDATFSKALSEGKVLPAEKDAQRGLYDLACKTGEGVKVLDLISGREAMVNVEPAGGSGKDGQPVATTPTAKEHAAHGDDFTLDAGAASDDAKITALAAAEGITYGEAFERLVATGEVA